MGGLVPDLPDAACRDAGEDLWTVDSPRLLARGVRVCEGCPERERCITWADEHEVTYGLWGGRWYGPTQPGRGRPGPNRPIIPLRGAD